MQVHLFKVSLNHRASDCTLEFALVTCFSKLADSTPTPPVQILNEIQHTVIAVEMFSSVIAALLGFFGMFSAIDLQSFKSN